MKCNGCAVTITRKLTSMPFVSSVIVDREENTILISYEKDENLPLIKVALANLGYPEDGEANTFTIRAKSFIRGGIEKVN